MVRKPSKHGSNANAREPGEGTGVGSPRRRSLLRAAAGAALVGGSVSALSSSAAAQQYEHVVDIVEDFGADPTGEETINDALADAVALDDVKIVFPSGTYWIGDGGFVRWRFGDGEEGEEVSNVALVGDGDVTLRPTPDTADIMITLWGDSVRIENVTIDQSATDTSTGISPVASELVVRDVSFQGTGDGPGGPTDDYGDNGERDGPFNILPGVEGSDNTGIIENVHMPDGTAPYYRKGGMWVNFLLHQGHLQINRCSFEGFSDNAVYASGPGRSIGGGGSVGVENCFFRNNNTTAIRLGTPGSYAKNCTVVFDGEIPPLPWGAVTGRAAWLWYGFDGTLENIDVVSDHDRGVGFYTHPSQSESFSVSNCRFELNADGTDALRSFTEGGPITARNVSITGEAGEEAPLRFANREVRFAELCLHQTGADRDGIWLTDATATIQESMIDVTGEQIVADDESVVTVRNLRAEGDCPPADPHHPMEQ